MARKNKYWINSGIVKSKGTSEDGHFRSLDKIVWDILKCCGIDCCSGNIGGGNTPQNLLLDNAGNLSITGGNTVSLGASSSQTEDGTASNVFVTPSSLTTFLSSDYVKDLFTITAPVINSLTLSNTLKPGFKSWILVSRNGQIQYEGQPINGYSVTNASTITLTTLNAGDIVEIRYFKA